MSPGAPRVAAYGYFGMGNLGNEGSLKAFLDYMRRTHPDVELSCFAAGADTVEGEHGVPATQLMTYRPAGGGPVRMIAKALSRLWDVPRTFALMRDVDVLVVPGTGVLETKLVATPWGLPYWLFLASLACRLRGRRVALVSVGAEYAAHPVTRLLYRWTVRLADYCTYRDVESLQATRSMGVKGWSGKVYPDLAFALPTPQAADRPGHVVIGVMAYDGNDPDRRAELRQTYVQKMADLVLRLVDDGRTVTLVMGDHHDYEPAEQIERLVRSDRPGLRVEDLAISRAHDLREVMQEMAEAEVVVASRFHNLICALKLTKPTVSVGYADKSARLLSEFGLNGFSQPVDTFDVDLLAAQVEEVPGVHASVEAVMKGTLERFDEQLREQSREFSQRVLRSATRRR